MVRRWIWLRLALLAPVMGLGWTASLPARAQSTFDGCGVLMQGFECMIFVADGSGEFYSLENLLTFTAGDNVHVFGLVDGSCVSTCYLPCILDNTIQQCVGEPTFVRGDSNQDGSFNIGDPIALLAELFAQFGGPSICADAHDANDDGAVNIADPIYQLSALFAGGPAPLAPYPLCGDDATASDPLDCTVFAACP